MSGQHVELSDWHRLLIGDTSWLFLVEAALRAFVVYLMLLLFMRLMGKRVAAGLSLSELAVILTLGAAAGLPLQSVDKGLLPAAVVLFTGLVFQRGLSLLAFRHRRVEVVAQGDVIVLLKEGRLLLDRLGAAQLSTQKFFSALRAQGILHLGQLRRVYMESSGQFSLIQYRHARPGLPIMPPDGEVAARLRSSETDFVCSRCGYLERHGRPPKTPCPYCGNAGWRHAVATEPSAEGGG